MILLQKVIRTIWWWKQVIKKHWTYRNLLLRNTFRYKPYDMIHIIWVVWISNLMLYLLIWTCYVKSLKSWTKKDREKVPMNNIELTKSLIRLPMEFWGDSMVNWKGMSFSRLSDRLSLRWAFSLRKKQDFNFLTFAKLVFLSGLLNVSDSKFIFVYPNLFSDLASI